MDKKEFQNLVIPLTKKERSYQQRPERSTEIYSQHYEELFVHNGVYQFDFPPERHGEILPDRGGTAPSGNLHFSKQTRFSQVPLHRHSYIEMNYVYAGECKAIINEAEIHLGVGDVCIMDAGVVHTIAPTQEEDIVLNCMMKQPYFNHRFREQLTNSGTVAKFIADTLDDSSRHEQYLIFQTTGNPLVQELFEDVFCEYLDPGICAEAAIDSYMTLLFIELARCYQQSKEQEYRRQERSYITEVLHYLEENCAYCTLSQTAEHFSFHPNYLSRVVKKATGKGFKEVVDGNRLSKAAFLLKNTELSVSDIADQCGWSNIRQFYRKFQQEYGCTPKVYRMEKMN